MNFWKGGIRDIQEGGEGGRVCGYNTMANQFEISVAVWLSKGAFPPSLPPGSCWCLILSNQLDLKFLRKVSSIGSVDLFEHYEQFGAVMLVNASM